MIPEVRDNPAMSARTPRLEGVDQLRGFAVAMMIAYHFCYDLVYFRFATWPMLTSPGWIAWRTSIVATFLTVAGVSLALRAAYSPSARAFWRRWAQVAGAALLVSAATAVMFHERFIYFGVLHFIAVGLIVGRGLAPLGRVNALIGLAVIALGVAFQDPMFVPRSLNWIGFYPGKPNTEDYVPVFPWIGVMLIGLAVGTAWRLRGFAPVPGLTGLRDALPARLTALLAFLGRWSLTVYLVHQPLLMGLLWLVWQARSAS